MLEAQRDFAIAAETLAQLYQRRTGWRVVRVSAGQSFSHCVPIPSHETPDLIGVPLQRLVQHAHLARGASAETVLWAWVELCTRFKEARKWKIPRRRQVLSQGLPAMPIGRSTEDPRIELAKYLFAAHQVIEDSQLEIREGLVRLTVSGTRLEVGWYWIDWPGYHFLMPERVQIDFTEHAHLPMVGTVGLDKSNAAVLHLLKETFAEMAKPIEDLFALASMAGKEYEQILRAPYQIEYDVPRNQGELACQSF